MGLRLGQRVGVEQLRGLVVGGERENSVLEFKSGMVDDAKLRAEVTALANTSGGHVLIGVEETGGIATGIPGLDLVNVDAEIVRVGQVLESRISPRLSGVDVYPVDIEDDKVVIVIEVPRSWSRPHSLTSSSAESLKFPNRSSTRVAWMDHDAVRLAFLSSARIGEAIKLLHQDAVAAVVAGQIPFCPPTGAFTLLSVTPLESLDNPQLELGQPAVPVIGDHATRHDWNLEGRVAIANGRPPMGFTQLYRTGRTTSADWSLTTKSREGEPNLLPSTLWWIGVRRACWRILQVLRELGVTGPTVLTITLHGVEGYTLAVGQGHFNAGPIRRAVIDLPPVQLAGPAVFNDELRPIADALFQAFGHEKAPPDLP